MRHAASKLALGLALAAWLVPAPAADAAVHLVVAGPGSINNGFTTPVAVYSLAGGAAAPLTLAVADGVFPHNAIALVPGPDTNSWCGGYLPGACPAFWSDTITTFQRTTPILGAEQLAPGASYPFFCSIHPWMTGDLVVVP